HSCTTLFRSIGLPNADRRADRDEIIERASQAEWSQERIHVLYLPGVARTPVPQGQIRRGGSLSHIERAGLDTELEAAEIELEIAVETRLHEIGRLILIVDAHDLRSDAGGI